MAFTVPPLPYASDALEPYIDKMTMEIHHGKHHGAYVTNLNKALESAPESAEQDRRGAAGQQLRDRAGEHPHGGAQQRRRAHQSLDVLDRSWRPARAAAPAGNIAQAINARVRQLRHVQGEIRRRPRRALRLRLGLAGEERQRARDHFHAPIRTAR